MGGGQLLLRDVMKKSVIILYLSKFGPSATWASEEHYQRSTTTPVPLASVMASSKPVDHDELMVEAAMLLKQHGRATQHEPLERVLVRSKRGGKKVRPAERSWAVEVIFQSASKKTKTR